MGRNLLVDAPLLARNLLMDAQLPEADHDQPDPADF